MSNVTGGTNPGIVIGGTGQSSVDTGDVTGSSQQRVTGVCPACEAAARERDAMHKGWSEATLRECKLSDELADLRARVAATVQTYSRDMHISADLGDLLEDLLTELRALLAEKEAK